jgi:hypothetical protein
VSVLVLTCGCTPIRPANIAAYDGGASPEVATGLVVLSSPVWRILRGAPWRLRTGHSARTSRDRSPATTHRRVPGTGFREVLPATGKDWPSERRRSIASEQGSAPAVSKQPSSSRTQTRRSCGQCRYRFREPSRRRARCRSPRPLLRARVPKQRLRPVPIGPTGRGLMGGGG